MRPQLFNVLQIGFPAYFVLLVTGFLFATTMGALWARRTGEDPDVIIDLGLAMLLAGVVGGRILHVFADGYFWDYVHLCTGDFQLIDWHITEGECAGPNYKGVWDAAKSVCHPTPAEGALGRFDQCMTWAKFWAGGMAYYGGFIGAVGTAWFLLKRDKFPFWKATDMAAFSVAIGLVFGRMGCLLAGCCFGIRSDSPLALVFPERSPASEWQAKAGLLPSRFVESLPVLPTQIFESAASLAIAAFCLIWLHPRKRYDGHVFVGFVALYALARFLLEFIRSDDRGGLLGLSTSQLIGVALIAMAYALHRARSTGKLAFEFGR